MLISALICGLNGAGSALGSPMPLGCCATERLDNAPIAMKVAIAATETMATMRMRMRFLSLDFYAILLHAPRSNDAAHQHQHEQPVTAVDQKQPPITHRKGVADDQRGDDEAEPAERARDDAATQRQLADMAKHSRQHPGHHQLGDERVEKR